MLDALVNLAGDAEFSEKLPPTGFYNYSQPIRWTVQISENGARLEESNLEGFHWARPYTGRTSGIDPHPLADEASYTLGIAVDDKGKTDERASDKHKSFMSLLEKIQTAPEIGDPLRKATEQVIKAIRQGWLTQDARYGEIKAKDWVAFELTYGPLAGQRLFKLPEAKAFWVMEAQERIAVRDSEKNIVVGECAVCGQNKPLIGRIPVGVRIVKSPRPIHSYNQTAFLSGKGEIKRKVKGEDVRVAHIDLCFECADKATQVLNTLAQDKNSRRVLVKDEDQPESLANQVALFWLEKGGVALLEADFDVISALGDLMKPVAASDDEDLEEGGEAQPKGRKGKKAVADAPKPQARLSQLANFLNIQHRAADYLTNIDGAKFALAVFSPNVGRTALREWLYKDLDKVIPHARLYLNATKINDSWGKPGEPQSINALMEALDSKNANLTRDLIRTAYEGAPPPQEMLVLAVQRFRTLLVKGKQDKQLDEWQRQRHLHALAAVLTDDETASSGEATLLTFRGLDNVRTFGEPTAGYASANVVLDYPDSRSLMLTTAKDKACTGEEFAEDPIAPDTPESELDGWLASHCGF